MRQEGGERNEPVGAEFRGVTIAGPRDQACQQLAPGAKLTVLVQSLPGHGRCRRGHNAAIEGHEHLPGGRVEDVLPTLGGATSKRGTGRRTPAEHSTSRGQPDDIRTKECQSVAGNVSPSRGTKSGIGLVSGPYEMLSAASTIVVSTSGNRILQSADDRGDASPSRPVGRRRLPMARLRTWRRHSTS